MSAILLGKNPLESMFESEEVESKQKNSLKDDKEQIIRGKNKTYVIVTHRPQLKRLCSRHYVFEHHMMKEIVNV